MLGVKLLPPQTSRVPVTFNLSRGAITPVLIPTKTQVVANPRDGGDSIVFETERSILATPAKLVEAFSTNSKEDAIFPAPRGFLTREDFTPLSTRLVFEAQSDDTSLFVEDTLQLKEGDLLRIGTFSNSEYAQVIEVVDNKVYIQDKLRASYSVDTLVEKVLLFELFEGKNQQKHILYLGHKEVFSVARIAEIFLEITSTAWIKLSDSDLVSWEYWGENQEGKLGWNSFAMVSVRERKLILQKNNDDEIQETEVNGIKSRWIRCKVKDILPPTANSTLISDLQTVELDIIKVSVKPLAEDETDTQVSDATLLEHCLTFNNLQYQNKTDESQSSGKPFKPFQPLESLLQENSHQALYLGFDAPPVKSPISLFFSLEIQEYTQKSIPRLYWEYYRRQDGRGQWTRLEIFDQTYSLTQTGIVEFVGSSDFAQTSRFGKSLYWIRVVDVGDKFKPFEKTPSQIISTENNQFFLSTQVFKGKPNLESSLQAPAPKIKGIYLNTTWAIQAERIKDEILGSSDGTANQMFTFLRFPLISEEIWVNELNILSFQEIKDLLTLANSGNIYIEETKDEKGNITEFWVKWEPVEELLESKPSARHYEIDRTFGQIKFGNGTEGAIPPIGINNIRANYLLGGGERGNVGSSEIVQLKSSIAFVDSVTNPEAAEGGSDTELLEQALERGSRILKHRNRAVTSIDFEHLTLLASRSIARVKCLPNINDEGKNELGWVTVIIIPKSSEAKPQPSLVLRQEVEKYLYNRTANIITAPKHLYISGPAYVEIEIETLLIANNTELLPSFEKTAMQKLRVFLNPLTGGYFNQGWEFGRLPCLSDFYSLLGSIPGLDRVESLSMTVKVPNSNIKFRVTSDSPLNINMAAYALVSSGKHQIDVQSNTML
jgi:hypothetical protein